MIYGSTQKLIPRKYNNNKKKDLFPFCANGFTVDINFVRYNFCNGRNREKQIKTVQSTLTSQSAQ